jgi:ribosomal subunit interface protein
MHIDVRGHLKATEAIHRHIDRRLSSALGRFRHCVREVTVRLEDINGPGKGGPDKACQIALHFDGPRRQPVRVEEVHTDLYLAITQAAERLSQAVRREVGRMRHARPRSSAMAS